MLYVVWTIHRIYVCRTLYSKYSIVDGVNLVSHQLGCVQTPLITLTKGEKKKKKTSFMLQISKKFKTQGIVSSTQNKPRQTVISTRMIKSKAKMVYAESSIFVRGIFFVFAF